jgi:myo-inositol-1(or 4)-monophosphatase
MLPLASWIDVTPYIPIVEADQSQGGDLEVAIAAVRAAATAAEAARAAPLDPRAKSVSADLVTAADAAAEAAAAAVVRKRRPADGILGEEGTHRQGGGRRWLIDGIDGTVAFASGLPAGWCSAIALEDAHGAAAAAVLDPATGELHAAARGAGERVNRVRRGRSLGDAHVATFLRQDRLVLPGVRAAAHRLLDAAGLIRHAGPGSLELAWVAAGRLDAWIQPHVDPWDWLPGALLVTEAGGEARVVHAATRWHIAGAAPLVEELAALALGE